MAASRAQTARGALAGAVAAGVWAAQQPLDKKLFGVDYDDADLLGGFVTDGPAAKVVGLAMHLGNGALFGAVYANVAKRMPLPSWARGPLAGLGEDLSTWPAMALIDRDLALSPRAFAQATWRHLLFGTVLGELERRFNAPEDPEVASYEHVVSSNGHGNLEQAIGHTA